MPTRRLDEINEVDEVKEQTSLSERLLVPLCLICLLLAPENPQHPPQRFRGAP